MIKRILFALTLLAAPASAQTYPTPTFGSVTTSTQGGASGNVTAAGPINTTSASGYQIGGLNALRLSTSVNEQALFIGPYSGASYPSGGNFVTAIGTNTFQSLNVTSPESVAIGQNAGIGATTSSGNVLIGISAGAGLLTNGDSVVIGVDAMRDSSGSGIAIGSGVLGDGTGAGNIGIGPLALAGAASTITIGGTFTTGDVMRFTLSTSNACNGSSIVINCTTNAPVTVSYTVPSGATASSVAAALASPLSSTGINYTLGDGSGESQKDLFGVNFSVYDAANPTVLKGHYPARWNISIGYSCTGTCGETATIGAGFTGSSNIVMGYGSFQNEILSTASNNLIIGNNIGGANTTTATYNVILGSQAAQNITTGNFNVGEGWQVLNACTNCSRNVAIGGKAGFGITSGTTNVIIGDQVVAGQTCITGGSSNIELGQGACVPSPTSNNQMSIANAIWGLNNSGTGATGSTGQIGVMTPAPNATFTIGDGAGAATYGSHIGVLQTTAPVLSACGTSPSLSVTASDTHGTITQGATATGCVVTFNKAYATAPDCVVTSPTGSALISYSVTTTALTMVNASASGNKYSYMCMQ
jgi:hypothetical protein